MFQPIADASQIQQFLTTHHLTVIMSWFAPALTGNEIAWFQCSFSPNDYPTFDAAFTAMSAQPLVQFVEPNGIDHEQHYSSPYVPGALSPNDYEFTSGWCRYPEYLGLHQTTRVGFGPESVEPAYGNWFLDTVVAVIDDGVWRNNEDLMTIMAWEGPDWENHLQVAGKATWVGVEVDNNNILVGRLTEMRLYGEPNPDFRDPLRGPPGGPYGLHSHGTRIAGVISAGTNNGVGVAGLAPRLPVLPVRLFQAWDPTRKKYTFTNDSTYKAVNQCTTTSSLGAGLSRQVSLI